MKIISIRLARLSIPLVRPFITAVRRAESVEGVVVMIITDDGKVGYGSAAAAPSIAGGAQESIFNAIQHHIAPQLIRKNLSEFNHLLHLTETSLQKNTSAKAAIDIALHDLFAQQCQLLLYQFLGDHNNTVSNSITISAKETNAMIADALDFFQSGYSTLKIKPGLDPTEYIVRVAAIREAVGYDVTLLLDANQDWHPKEATRIIHAFKQNNLNIQWIEQPIKATDREHLKIITEQVTSSIIADETCFSPSDTLYLTQHYICDGINIKLMKEVA